MNMLRHKRDKKDYGKDYLLSEFCETLKLLVSIGMLSVLEGNA